MADGAGAMVERSPSDVLRLVVAALSLATVWLVDVLFGDDVVSYVGDLLAGADELPEDLLTAVIVLLKLTVLVVLVVGLVWALVRRHLRLLVTVAVATALAAIYGFSNDSVTTAGGAVASTADVLGKAGDPVFPDAVGLAVAAAVFTAAAPWLPRRSRRLGWVLLVAVVGVRLLTAPLSADGVLALLWGWTAGAAAVVALGAPQRRPTAATIMAGLRGVGIEVDELEPAAVDARGSTPYFGRAGDRRLFVKVLGRDERSADLLFRAYRMARRSLLGDERPFSSLRRAVEHEALLADAAPDLGVRTPGVAGFATVEPNAFVLAYEGIEGKSLDGVPVEDMTDELLAGVWGQIALLRRHRIAHRDLRLANVFRAADGEPWMIDFGFSELAASDLLLATDVAELMASLALVIGPERAVGLAVEAVGPEAVAAAEPRLRPATLSGATRHGMKEAPHVLDDLKQRAAACGS